MEDTIKQIDSGVNPLVFDPNAQYWIIVNTRDRQGVTNTPFPDHMSSGEAPTLSTVIYFRHIHRHEYVLLRHALVNDGASFLLLYKSFCFVFTGRRRASNNPTRNYQ